MLVAIPSTDPAFEVGITSLDHLYSADPVVPDESFSFSHDRAGLLSMANRGPHTNSSQVRATLCFFTWFIIHLTILDPVLYHHPPLHLV